MDGAAPGGIEDPVETRCEDEEGEEVQGFVVDVIVFELEGGETGVGCCCDAEEESSCGGGLLVSSSR